MSSPLLPKLFILFVIFCVFTVYAAIRNLVRNSDDIKLKQTSNYFLIIILGWITVLYALAKSGILLDFSSFPPRIMVVLMIPFLTILYFTFNKRTGKLLALVPHSWLIYIQSFRIGVELMLWWMYLEFLLPVQMTFEGLNFDIVAGLSAPIAVYVVLKHFRANKVAGIIWNIFGLALLINIVSIAILSLPTPVQVFTNGPSNTIIATFPYILLPGILVPLAYSMHFLSIRKFLNEPRS